MVVGTRCILYTGETTKNDGSEGVPRKNVETMLSCKLNQPHVIGYRL